MTVREPYSTTTGSATNVSATPSFASDLAVGEVIVRSVDGFCKNVRTSDKVVSRTNAIGERLGS